MLHALKVILDIQERDMKLIRLMQLKQQRKKELSELHETRNNLKEQVAKKEGEILELKRAIRVAEETLQEILANIKKLEAEQSAIKKVDEYNAMMNAISAADRERVAQEQRLSDLYDRLAAEEEVIRAAKENYEHHLAHSEAAELEILESMREINAEGRMLQEEREELARDAEPETLRVYERLLANKQDRVVVSLDQRCCSGCHIMLTAQHENLVRKREKLVFCEHCSRIHYWDETQGTETTLNRGVRRRRGAAKAS